MAESLFVVGVNHRGAPAPVRDALFFEPRDYPRLLAALRQAGIAEAAVLSTCERIEVVAADGNPRDAADAIAEVLATEARQTAPDGFDPRHERAGFVRFGEQALRHLFAVAASLDSQILGEPHILGQVKESHRVAAAAAMVGPDLEAALQAAYAAAKRIRTETAIAEQPVSLSASALMLARQLHGDLARAAGALVGLGEMSELLAQDLQRAGLRKITVLHRRLSRAEAAARRLACHVRPWEELDEAVAESDLVVTACGTGSYVIDRARAAAALKRRRRKPIFFIDAAVPSDVDPAVEDLDGAFVYDLEDLDAVARQGRASREATAVDAWELLGREVAAYQRQQAERGAVPAVVALRRHFESVRDQILADGGKDAETATRLLINRLLHDPSEALRQAASSAGEDDPGLAATVERLFGLAAAGTGGKPGGGSGGGGEKA